MLHNLNICTILYTESLSENYAISTSRRHRQKRRIPRLMGSGIGKAMVRQPFFCTLVVAIACLESAVANALQPSPLALEGQAQAEFAKVGTAVRERLEREATGDLIGSHVAVQDAEAPRYRFLDVKRAISRLRSPS